MNIPKGHQAVMPYLMMEDAAGFIEFIKSVFNAEMMHQDKRGDMIGHCEANINGSTIMFSNSRDEWKPATANMFVYVDDADASFQRRADAFARQRRRRAERPLLALAQFAAGIDRPRQRVDHAAAPGGVGRHVEGAAIEDGVADAGFRARLEGRDQNAVRADLHDTAGPGQRG